MPVFATVHARIVASAAIPDGRGSGASVAPFESATLGTGVQVSGTASLDDVRPGTTAAFVIHAFDDGESTVVVSARADPRRGARALDDGPRGLIDRIEVERPDGSASRSTAPAVFVADGGWPIEEGSA